MAKTVMNRPTETNTDRRRGTVSEGVLLDVYESYVEGELYRYSYALIHTGRRRLGYDNAPHHKDLATYPDHKHVDDVVEPLHEPSLEGFLKEAKRLLGKA